jgi:hypothetical protein
MKGLEMPGKEPEPTSAEDELAQFLQDQQGQQQMPPLLNKQGKSWIKKIFSPKS